MTGPRRTLILMRHAKAADGMGLPDRQRPLTGHGRDQARSAGDWIRDRLSPVEQVLCSPAQRTRETLQATGITAPATFDGAIYEASVHALITALGALSPETTTALLIGHSPGIPWTAWELAANRSGPAATELSTEFPPGALAVLEFTHPWDRIGAGSGELIHFRPPAELSQELPAHHNADAGHDEQH